MPLNRLDCHEDHPYYAGNGCEKAHLPRSADENGTKIHAAKSLAGAELFETPIEDLILRGKEDRPRRSTNGKDLDTLISSHFARQQKPLSWYHHPSGSFLKWKASAQSTLAGRLIVPGSLGAPVDPVVTCTVDHGDFIEEHVEFTVTPPFRAEAIVTIPVNGAAKHPALVLLHSLGSLTLFGKEKLLSQPGEPGYLKEYREELYEGRSLLAEFARAGYLCIAIDAFGFGKRTASARLDPAGFEEKRKSLNRIEAEALSLKIYQREGEEVARALGTVGLSIAALTATDDLRTVDYLGTRADVDTQRIGCTGLSFGSFRCNYLAALDERIRAVASVCWISTLDGIINYNVRHSMGFFSIPGDLYQHFDMVDIVMAAAPKPFLAVSGWKDLLMQPKGIADAYLAMRQAWKASGNPEALGSLVFDVPHEFNKEMQEYALRFFQRHL